MHLASRTQATAAQHANLTANASSGGLGAQLAAYYENVGVEFGISGRMKLALFTSINSTAATAEPDSPANIKKFELAIAQIRKAGTG